MCNLYSLNKKRDAVARFFRVSHNRGAAFEPLSAIFPGHVAPVIRQSSDGDREIVLMSWGFVLLQKDRAPRRVTNVRDDKILESRFWRGSFEERRCLVPATSFCEPNGDVKPATWHWFALQGQDDRPMFVFPGIWRRYQGPVKKDGPKVDIEVYAFLTTTPNNLVATINHERMPVLLTREEERCAAPCICPGSGIPARPNAHCPRGLQKAGYTYRCGVNPGRLIVWRPWPREQAVPFECMEGATISVGCSEGRPHLAQSGRDLRKRCSSGTTTRSLPWHTTRF